MNWQDFIDKNLSIRHHTEADLDPEAMGFFEDEPKEAEKKTTEKELPQGATKRFRTQLFLETL